MSKTKPRRRTNVTPKKDGPLRLEYRTPGELADNPRNWREHPSEQVDALRDVLAEVGWAGAVLFNEKTGRLIDGHARKKIAGATDRIPVLVGSWSEDDEAKILATLDPLAAMATTNAKALDALLADVRTQSMAVNAMLTELAAGLTIPEGNKPIDEEAMANTEHQCPKCGFQW